MPTLNFKLRQGKNTSVPIYLIYSYGKDKRLRYSTGIKLLNSKNWNSDAQKVRNVVEEINKLAINNKLNETRAYLEKLYSKLTIDDHITITNDLLKNELDIFFKKKARKQTKDRFLELIPFFEWYLEHYKTNPLPTTKKSLGKGTHKTYNNALNILKKFNEDVYSLNYEKMTLDFYDDYINYLYSKNLSTNYVGTQIKIVKTILNASFEKDFHSNTDFKKRYFAKPFEEVNNIYLNQKELLNIYDLELINVETIIVNKTLKLSNIILENAKDLFLIGANTGLRISDLNKLTEKNIITVNGNKYLNITTTKTGVKLTIPINPMVNAILKKRDGKPPQTMPDQHLNYAIKEIGKLAHIDTNETKTITKGGKKVVINLKKYQLISSHTARRSFCTNAYKSGMPTIDIMAISGHKTERVFYSYIKVNDIERAEKIKKHKFFTDNNLKLA